MTSVISKHGTTPVAKGETLIQLENLKVEYLAARGSVRAVDGVSLSIGKGEVLGICEIDNIYYPFDYRSLEDTTLYVYSYTSPEDIASLITENPGAASMVTSSFSNKCNSFIEVYTELLQDCQNLYDSAAKH